MVSLCIYENTYMAEHIMYHTKYYIASEMEYNEEKKRETEEKKIAAI